MKPKICAKCKKEKSIKEFGAQKSNKDGLRNYCKSCVSIKNKQNRQKNPEYNKNWRDDNPEYRKLWDREKLKTPRGNLNNRMRLLIYDNLKGRQNSPTLKKLVGYTPHELRKHFESLFTEGMNWNNHGKWQIDHIRPICSFDYNSFDDLGFQECWALKNLQPLWKKDNIKKGTSIQK